MKVCINPAHLMETPGKVTPKDALGNVIHECEQNFPIAFKLAKQLEHNGIDTVLTETNMYKSLPSGGANADMYDRIYFEQKSNCDLYVSLHKNASPTYDWNSISGTETIIYARGGNAEKLANITHPIIIKNTGDKDRGVKVMNLAEVRETKAPAVLFELGFMTNVSDAQDMLNEKSQELYAYSIAEGICKYFGVNYTKYEEEPEEKPSSDLKAQLQAIHDNQVALNNDLQKLIDTL